MRAEGRPAHIIVKNNAVTDPGIIRALYRASQAGVEIDLIVRGVCCLKPGIPGVSERIRVRSVVGRFLEHSRVYWFANNGAEEVYLGSADLMERNLDRRVEAVCRVRDAAIAHHIRHVVLEAYLREHHRAYELIGATYQPIVSPPGTPSAQQHLLAWYADRAGERRVVTVHECRPVCGARGGPGRGEVTSRLRLGVMLRKRIAAECAGTALCSRPSSGPGIMGDRLSGGNVAIALLANAIATGATLVAIILAFGPISGAHLNPAVTIADATQGGLPWREVPPYLFAQIVGAFVGVAAAHLMFGLPLFAAGRLHERSGSAQIFSEAIATFGLLSVIWGCGRTRPDAVPSRSAPTSPARIGLPRPRRSPIRQSPLPVRRPIPSLAFGPTDVPGFVLGQLAGAGAATILFRWLAPGLPRSRRPTLSSAAKEDRR